MKLPVAMTIAGSDSGGGAGIQADLKTFYACGVHGTCAITSVTSQNTLGVLDRYDLPSGVVVSQIEAVLSDIQVKAVKTGMLATAEIVGAVAEILGGRGLDCLVMDPVILSSWGQPLLDEGGIRKVTEGLLPLTRVFTPNIAEAAVFLGKEIESREAMREAARSLLELGPACVVVKGGHLDEGEEAVDVFCDGRNMQELSGERIGTADTHGTGCVFSAAIAAYLALGDTTLEAVCKAKRDVGRSLMNSLSIGAGKGPVHLLPGPLKGSG